MESGQSNELELVSHFCEFPLEARDGCVVELSLPMERRRAVVRQQFTRKTRVNGLGETACLLEIRFRGFTPDQIGVRCVSQAADDRRIKAASKFEKSLGSPPSANEGRIARIGITEQQTGAVGVGTGD